MNNPEKPATLDTQDTALRQIKQKNSTQKTREHDHFVLRD